MPIAIIDPGSGNLKSVQKAFQQLGETPLITQNKEEINKAGAIVLPGVGAFDASIKELRKKGLEEVILQAIAQNKPFLGICIGMQLLFEKSQEGAEKGLGVIEGEVKKFDFKGMPYSNLKIPHMGWNRLLVKQKNFLLDGIKEGDMFYFVHSYYAAPKQKENIIANTDYGMEFASIIFKGNIFAVQFHPEKSGEKGLKILSNFVKLSKQART